MAKSMGKSALGKGSDYYDEKTKDCQPCSVQGKGDIPANSFCVDCQEYLCQTCATSHKAMKAMRNHVMVTTEEAKRKALPMVTKDKCSMKCTVHHDKTVKYFCVSHAYLGCSVCITMNHKQCTDVDYIPTVAKDIRNHDGFKKFDKKLKALETACKTGISDVEKNLKKIKADERQMKEAIKQFRKKLNNALDKYEKELTVKAETISREETKKLNVISKELAKFLVNVDTLVDKVDNLLFNRNNCDAYVLMKKEVDHLISLDSEMAKAVQGASCQRYEFQPNRYLLKADALGRLNIRSETVRFSAAVTALSPIYKDGSNSAAMTVLVPHTYKDGPEMETLLKKGTRVRRGKDWLRDYGNQDGGGLGTIEGTWRTGWYNVKWDNGNRVAYRMGYNKCYDLEIV